VDVLWNGANDGIVGLIFINRISIKCVCGCVWVCVCVCVGVCVCVQRAYWKASADSDGRRAC
jgi:hypothetical protein